MTQIKCKYCDATTTELLGNGWGSIRLVTGDKRKRVFEIIACPEHIHQGYQEWKEK